MAIYIWKCKECDYQETVERTMADSEVPPPRCESCHKENQGWIKQITRTGFVLKGGGWYKDGYNKKEG